MNKAILTGVLVVVVGGAAFWAGWHWHGVSAQTAGRPTPLRTGGFEFVKPLLVCDSSTQRLYPELAGLNSQLNNLIASQEKAGAITSASIAFNDFATGGRIGINPTEKFDPASIAKLAVLIAYLKMAEYNPGLLDKEITYNITANENAKQLIQPKVSAQVGKQYTVQDLLSMMILYSDNNAYYGLLDIMDRSQLQSIYHDLGIPELTAADPTNLDKATTNDISYLFRILYNGTYLLPEVSDQALQLLSQSDYKDGLVAGVPAGTAVAHKFGQATITQNNGAVAVEQEFHDCGIIYNQTHPYFLCVMTKGQGNADPAKLQGFIKQVSSLVSAYITAPSYQAIR